MGTGASNMNDAVRPQLWTTWSDYSATGEGRMLMVRITYAIDHKEARSKFEEQFGAYYAIGCETERGAVLNYVTGYLLSDSALNFARQCNGALNIVASLHVNFS